MKRLVLLLIVVPLLIGAMSGHYTRKIIKLPKYSPEILEDKAKKTLEHCTPEINGEVRKRLAGDKND